MVLQAWHMFCEHIQKPMLLHTYMKCAGVNEASKTQYWHLVFWWNHVLFSRLSIHQDPQTFFRTFTSGLTFATFPGCTKFNSKVMIPVANLSSHHWRTLSCLNLPQNWKSWIISMNFFKRIMGKIHSLSSLNKSDINIFMRHEHWYEKYWAK